MRSAVTRLLFARPRDERAEPRAVDVTELGAELIEGLRFGDQPIAPMLERVLARGIDALPVRPVIEASSDRIRIDLAHQLADVL